MRFHEKNQHRLRLLPLQHCHHRRQNLLTLVRRFNNRWRWRRGHFNFRQRTLLLGQGTVQYLR